MSPIPCARPLPSPMSARLASKPSGYQHPTWRERCEQLETALAAAIELKRRAEQPECEPDFQRMPTYVKNLHANLFAALPIPNLNGGTTCPPSPE